MTAVSSLEKYNGLSDFDKKVYEFHAANLTSRLHAAQKTLGMTKDEVGLFCDDLDGKKSMMDDEQRDYLARHKHSLLDNLTANGEAAKFLRTSYETAQEMTRSAQR